MIRVRLYFNLGPLPKFKEATELVPLNPDYAYSFVSSQELYDFISESDAFLYDPKSDCVVTEWTANSYPTYPSFIEFEDQAELTAFLLERR